ncbi:MAG: hypothetical protein AAF554_04335 [Bacteroidota bacterium]
MIRTKWFFLALLTLVFAQGANAFQNDNDEEIFDLETVEYVEENSEWELGFDTSAYLPEGFDPYTSVVSINTINFIDLCEDVEEDFGTAEHLPQGFDPYTR